MPKRNLRTILVSLAAYSLVLSASTQETATVAAAMPRDPERLVSIALKVNSFSDADSRPWLLKASFHKFTAPTNLFPEENKEGKYEEIWAAGDKFKQSYSDEENSQTVYGTPNGKAIAGGLRFILADLRQIHEFFQPAEFLRQYAEGKDPELDPASLHSGEAACIRTIQKSPRDENAAPNIYRFCFDDSLRLVRFSINGDDDFLILFRGSRPSNGRAIPTDVELRRHGIVRQTAHLESLEAAEGVDDAEFKPPADALADESEPPGAAMPQSVNVAPGVAEGMLEHYAFPVYPPEAKAAGISGTVILSGTIETDGLVHNLKAISGPPVLRQAAMDAVQSWRYRPYVLNGEKVAVGTTFNVAFVLNQTK